MKKLKDIIKTSNRQYQLLAYSKYIWVCVCVFVCVQTTTYIKMPAFNSLENQVPILMTCVLLVKLWQIEYIFYSI